MGKLNKEQIQQLTDKQVVFGAIKLKCDGYVITLQDGLYKRKVRTRLYVNNAMNVDWWVEPDKHPESKFYLPSVIYRKKSPRSKKKEKIELDMRQPDFASVGQALRYLNKVCDNVSLVEDD